MSHTPRPGIAALAGYLPLYRLTSAEIDRTMRRSGGRPGQRRLAGFDEDPVTMTVEAVRQWPEDAPADALIFCTTTPPYLGKNNASAAHAALGLAPSVAAYDAGGSFRSANGALLTSAAGTLLLAGDLTTARPGAAGELTHGDGGVAVLLGPADQAVVTIERSVSETDELLDFWRLPGEPWLTASEDRFPVSQYGPALERVLQRLDTTLVDHVIVSAPSPRIAAMAAKRLAGIGPVHTMRGVGFTGCADLLLQLTDLLAVAEPGRTILAVSLTDGLDAMVLRTTGWLADRRPQPLRAPTDGVEPAYLDALTWRGLLLREPPRRPEPNPVSPSASGRGVGWKFQLHGSICSVCGAVATPPQKVCVRCHSVDTGQRVDMARRPATVRTFSVDRLAYSPNPPLVAAVVDFDGGGRMEVEMTDTAPESLAIGQRVRMTFRRRHSSGGIHNYAWKAVSEESANG